MKIVTEKEIELAEVLKHFLQDIQGHKFPSDKPHVFTTERFFNNSLVVSNAIDAGVTTSLFLEIKNYTPFDDLEWCTFLDINIRTYQRYVKQQSHRFKRLQSEKIFELLEMVSFGNEVFDSFEDFKTWLTLPSYALGSKKPTELLSNSYGIGLVNAELNKIEHGIFV